MIDTVVLSVPKNKVICVDMTQEGVSNWDLQSRSEGYAKYIKNPSPLDKGSGLYFPRLTEIKRKYGKYGPTDVIKIEFSVPKLVYLNNLDELEEKDFGRVLGLLETRLSQMGLIVTQDTLKQASVSAVHYSKNISLSDGYTSQYVLSELGKINLDKRFDLTRAKYTNDGQSISIYTNAHSLVIYDKIADLIKPKKRAIDKEQVPSQQSLFDVLAKKEEVLRFEVRLSKKRKLNSLFDKLGYEKNPTFEDVFKLDKSLSVMKFYWDSMVKDSATALFACSLTCKDLLKQILIADPLLKPNRALYLLSLIQIAKEGNGLRELRSILSKYSNNRTWYRIMDDYKTISKGLDVLKPRDWFMQVQDQIYNYVPYHVRE